MKRLLIDTGPLVAFLDRSDPHHEWAGRTWRTSREELVTCEAVIAEACHLLAGVHRGADSVLDLVRRRVLLLPFQLAPEADAVRALMTRYADVPMDLADACLVRMAELEPRGTVVTLDAGFRAFRKHGRHMVPVVMPA